jgi:ABC-2 type transport system permease protein
MEGILNGRALRWWTILRIALEERLVYRGDFALGTLMRFLPIVTQVFLWWSIYETIGGGSTKDVDIVGFSFQDMVAYYLLTMLSRAFSSMPGLASGIALQIRNGEIKKFIIQPVDMVGFLLLTRIAHKLAYYSVAFGPFLFVFFICWWRGYFVTVSLPWTTWMAFVASLIMGFLIGFFLEAAIGMIGFWFLEVSSLLFVYMLLSFFLSGHMFPLTMLPEPYRSIVDLLPLKYLAYFPAAICLKQVPADQLVGELLMEAAWLVFFIVMCRVMYNAGLRRYSGYGG